MAIPFADSHTVSAVPEPTFPDGGKRCVMLYKSPKRAGTKRRARLAPTDLALVSVSTRLDWASLEPILNAVGPLSTPPKLDGTALIRCLTFCGDLYVSALKAKQRRKQKRELELLLASLRRAEQRMKLLLPFEDVIAQRLIPRVQDKIADVEVIAKYYAGAFAGRSPFELLVGALLADTYKLNFERDAEEAVNGPFVRFAESVLMAFAITDYSRDTIRKALADDQSGRARGKASPRKAARWAFRRTLIEEWSGRSGRPPFAVDAELDNLVDSVWPGQNVTK